MLKGKQKKIDKNKDGKISGEDFKMMKKPGGAVLGAIALGLGAKKLMGNKKSSASPISPVTMLADVIRQEDKKNQTTGPILMPGDRQNQQQPQTTGQASKGKMMKARVGKSIESPGSKANKLKLAKQDKRKEKLKELRAKKVGPAEEMKEMNKLSIGGEPKGYGAARTQGQGLQDENLIPGKSLDYYKDIM